MATSSDAKGSDKLEALLNYVRQGSIDQAFDHAYAWVKDGSLVFSEWKLFLRHAAREMAANEKRQDAFRG